MMKKYVLILLLIVSASCKEQNKQNALETKNKTIDSLKMELEDCKGQAKIMADILEQERIDLQNKKGTK